MPEVLYRFDLEEDKELLKIYQQAEAMSLIIWEFTHNTKRITSNLDEKQFEGFEIAMNRFRSLIEEHGVICD